MNRIIMEKDDGTRVFIPGYYVARVLRMAGYLIANYFRAGNPHTDKIPWIPGEMTYNMAISIASKYHHGDLDRVTELSQMVKMVADSHMMSEFESACFDVLMIAGLHPQDRDYDQQVYGIWQQWLHDTETKKETIMNHIEQAAIELYNNAPVLVKDLNRWEKEASSVVYALDNFFQGENDFLM
jgi:hypothetical protein